MILTYERYISIGLLYSLFDEDCNVEIMNMLSEISIQSLDLAYAYDTSGNGNNFLAMGELNIGELLLNFQYKHNGKSQVGDGTTVSSWSFGAQLSVGSHRSSIVNILESICGPNSNIAGVIPNCFGNVPVSHVIDNPSAPFDPASSPVGLEIINVPANPVEGQSACLLMKLSITVVDDIRLTFIQYQRSASLDKPDADGTPRLVKTPVKRVAKLSVGRLPGVSGVPVLGALAQPFDEMDFIWVNEGGEGEKDGGLTRSELAQINREIFGESGGLRYKDPYITPEGKHSGGYNGRNILLSTGSHFIIVHNHVVVLDYPFNSAHTTATPAFNRQPSSLSTTPAAPTSDSGSSKAPLKTTIGPLAISNIALHFANDRLKVLLDVTVSLGPIQMSLLDFGLGFDLAHASLHDLSNVSVDLELRGLGLGLSAPPLQISGMFEKNEDIYMGGVSLAVEPYLFLAVGEYGTVVAKDIAIKCLFVFAQLDGPLVNIGVAEIMGVKAGFGHNTTLRYPDLTSIHQFPFTQTLEAVESTNPLQLLTTFLAPASGPAWVTPAPGPLWIAAGLEVSLSFALQRL